MSSAIAKISWRLDSQGVADKEQVFGGINGSCFTLASGWTIAAAHVLDDIFAPHEGYDRYRVFILELCGTSTVVEKSRVIFYPEFDACLITGYQSGVRYSVSARSRNDIVSCHLRGFRARAAPFKGITNGPDVELFDIDIASAAQDFNSLSVLRSVFTIDTDEIKVSKKLGFAAEAAVVQGLSGGPMLDAFDGTVVGMCFVGLPENTQATQAGALDIREFPFL